MKNRKILANLILPAVALIYIYIYIVGCSNAFATATASGNVKMSVQSNYSIEVVLPALDTLTLTPSAGGSFSSQNVTVGVGTNNPTGYTLTMSSTSTNLTRSAAINGSTPTISTLESAVAEASFPANRWGYKRTAGSVTDMNYQPMVANANIPLNGTEGPANAQNSQSTINFGVKLNNDTPSGTYSITLTFLAVANEYIEDTTLYMQDMTLADCPSDEEALVTDGRDGQEYTVTQLDGVCVMTQNLRYIGGGETLFSGLVAGTASGATMENSAGSTFAATFSGDYSMDDAYFYFDTSRLTAYEDFISDSYGVYYNFAAASGGTITGNENTDDITASVCPEGWTLPESSTDGSDTWGGISTGTITGSGLFDVFAGLYNGGDLVNDGGDGYWWSANANDEYLRYDLIYLVNGYVDAEDYYDRVYLFSVRCVLGS